MDIEERVGIRSLGMLPWAEVWLSSSLSSSSCIIVNGHSPFDVAASFNMRYNLNS